MILLAIPIIIGLITSIYGFTVLKKFGVSGEVANNTLIAMILTIGAFIAFVIGVGVYYYVNKRLIRTYDFMSVNKPVENIPETETKETERAETTKTPSQTNPKHEDGLQRPNHTKFTRLNQSSMRQKLY